ncbi:hypothetical protein BJF90_30405 [Pseudonocardia sp. CNS-004]|nr:hypothetical protein BJF90_30405 [Pseudonocardia sp. CNS-004]
MATAETSAVVSSRASAQYRMPSWLTCPSTDCTRCSSGSSADRDCGYWAMISFVRWRVSSSNFSTTGPASSTTGSNTTSSGPVIGP